MIYPKGSMYRVNSNGPSTEPCGTPYWNLDRKNIYSFTATNWKRSDKHDLNHANEIPLMPTSFWGLFKRMLWSMVGDLVTLPESVTERELCEQKPGPMP